MPILTTMHKVTQQEILDIFDINQTFLTIHNFGSNMLEYLEIGMPYMIIYESCSINSNKMCVYEFTESSHSSSQFEITQMYSPKRPLHMHNFYELTFILSGELHMQIENDYKSYHSGEFCICNKNIRHIENINSDCEFVCLMFTEEYFEDILKNDIFYDVSGTAYIRDSFMTKLFLENRTSSFQDTKKYIDFTLNQSIAPEIELTPILEIINALVDELREKKPGSNFFLKGLFCRLFFLLENHEYYIHRTYKLPMSKSEELFTKIGQILDETNGIITRAEMEARLNYNGDYLNRIVKQHIGKTLGEYKKFFLLKEAERLLISSTKTIGEICDYLGYTNHTYFNKIFSEKNKMTPKNFRKTSEKVNSRSD